MLYCRMPNNAGRKKKRPGEDMGSSAPNKRKQQAHLAEQTMP